MERELTLATVFHPDTLPGHDKWILVEHPTTDVLHHGDPALGWEGDSRLAIYLDVPHQRFALWRLEADYQYRMIAQLPPHASITKESMNRLISRLVEIDGRRGHDPLAVVEAAAAKREADAEAAAWDAIENHVGPKLKWALEKDGF